MQDAELANLAAREAAASGLAGWGWGIRERV